MTCTTHHNACDCREAALQERIASLQAENTHWCSVANQRALDLASERQRVRVLEEALRGYLDGCDNDECEACENARKALGEG